MCSLLHRSCNGNLNGTFSRNFHTSTSHNQKVPQSPDNKNKKPDKEDDDDNKISSLLAKAFLWMLTAYMVIAIISLLFPSSNQPEVIYVPSFLISINLQLRLTLS